MHSIVMIIFPVVLFYPNVLGIYLRSFEHTSDESENDSFKILHGNSEISTTEYRTDEQHLDSTSNIFTDENFRSEEPNFTSSSVPMPSTKNISSTQVDIILTEIFSNESNSTSSVPHISGSPSSSTGQTKSSIKSTKDTYTVVSSTEDEEQEEVVRGKPSSTENNNATTLKPETIYQKAMALMNDTYTLSILIPVAAGLVFASTIIVTIATCRCLRRQCRRRRLRKKILPDSVKHLRPSDRARLLAESSDEEF